MGETDDVRSGAARPPVPPERRRRRTRRIVRVLVGLAVLWIAAAAVIGARGALAARAGAQAVRGLDLGVEELLDGDIDGRLASAHGDFETADRFLSSPVLAPVRLAPVAGRQLRSAMALAGTGREVLGASTSALDALRAELDDGSPTGAERVASLARLRAELEDVDDVLSSVDLGPDEALIGPLRDARNEVAAKLQDARTRTDDVRTIVEGMHDVLDGPSRYLVLAANNAEMRIGSGMFLSIGVIEISEGRVTVSEDFRPAAEMVSSQPIPLPSEMEHLWGWSDMAIDYRSLGLSARFPVSAQVGAQLWSASGHGDVDGVLAIDVDGIAALLAIAGPVEVDGRRIEAGNVRDHLLREQYEGVVPGEEDTNDERRDRLRVLAGAALERFGTTDLDLRALLDGLRAARDGRHLMAWSPRPHVQAAWEVMDVDGDLDPRSVLIGLANFDTSKLDPYIGTAVRVAARRDGDDAVVEMAIDVANGAPEGLPRYVAARDGGSSYLGVVSAHVPSTATEVDLVGFDGRAAIGRDGPTVVIAARVEVARGETRTGTLRFRIPASDLAEVRIEPSARIPAVRWELGGEDRTDDYPMEWPPHVP